MSLFSLPKASWKMLSLLLLVGFHVKLSSEVMKKCKDIFVGNEALVSAWKQFRTVLHKSIYNEFAYVFPFVDIESQAAATKTYLFSIFHCYYLPITNGFFDSSTKPTVPRSVVA